MVDTSEGFGPLPDLSPLPGWVQVVAYIVLAVALGVAGFMARFGYVMGRGNNGAPEKSAEVAAVIVDSRALDRLTDAAVKLEAAISHGTDVLAQLVADGREDRQDREIEDEVQRRLDQQLREQRSRQRRAARTKT